MKTFKIITLGCKVNQYETQAMREQLISAGLKEVNPHTKYFGVGVNSHTPADLYIVNTCTVTQDTDRECRRFLRRCAKENPKASIVATGCYAENDAGVIKEINSNIIILKKGTASDFLAGLKGVRPIEEKSEAVPIITYFEGRTKAFIKIQDGCDNFCSYCKVPYVRGNPRSRNKDEIIMEAQNLIKNNYKELVLCGICLGSYGKGLKEKVDLTDIVSQISDLSGDFRIRLSSIEMQDVNCALINLIKDRDNICNHLHIPLQSGDDEILKNMNRKYTSAEFINQICKIKEEIPGIAISTDIIVGFPGESESAFNNTLNTIEKIQPMRTHIFTYSKRDGTSACNLKGHVKKCDAAKRYKIIKKATDKIAGEYYECSKTLPQRVLVEDERDKLTKKLCGYSDTYVRLVFDGSDELIGKFAFLQKSKKSKA